MAKEFPKRFNATQFSGIVNRSLKKGSLTSKGVQDALRSSHAVKRAMAKSSMTDREAKTAFKLLHEKGLLKGERLDHKDIFRKAVRTGQTKGEFAHVETLHEKAVRERTERRKEKAKRDQVKEENMARYEQEKKAEMDGVLDNPDGVVKMQAHGVAIKADKTRAGHSVSAAQVESKKPSSKPSSTILPDMFT